MAADKLDASSACLFIFSCCVQIRQRSEMQMKTENTDYLTIFPELLSQEELKDAIKQVRVFNVIHGGVKINFRWSIMMH